jgi:hypothetical protein
LDVYKDGMDPGAPGICSQFRRLGVRYRRRTDLLQGQLHLARMLICLRYLGLPGRYGAPGAVY